MIIRTRALLAMCGLLAIVACQQPAPSGPVASRIEISPSSWMAVGVGESQTFSALVYDQHGQPMEEATVSWSSSRPDVIAVTGGATGGVATTQVDLGSAMITASVGSLRAEVLAFVAEPAPGALLLSDAQIVGAPLLLTPHETLEDDEMPRFEVQLRDVDLPAPGQIVLSTGETSVAGRVLAVSGQTVELEMAPINELFQRLRIEETMALTDLDLDVDVEDEDDGATMVRLPDGSWQISVPIDGAIDPSQVTFRLGRLSCVADAGIQAGVRPTVLTVNLLTNMDFDFAFDIEDGVVQRALIRAGGSVGLTVSGGIRFTIGITGSLNCRLPIANIPVPVTGPLAGVVTTTIPIGLAFNTAGTLAMNVLEIGLQGQLKPTIAIGFDYRPETGFTNLSDFSPGISVTPRIVLPGDQGFRLDASTSFLATAGLGIGNSFISFDVLTLGIGPKMTVNLATVADQILDAPAAPDYKSTYTLDFIAEFGLGADIKAAIKLLTGSEDTISLKAGSSLRLASSPTGTAMADVTSFEEDDTVTFTVDLDPHNLTFIPLINNISEVRIYRRTPEGPGPVTMIASATGVPNQTTYEFPWTATDDGQIAGQFSAVVVPVFLFFAPLEIARVSEGEQEGVCEENGGGDGIGRVMQITGDVTVATDAEVAELDCVTTISGTLTIQGPQVTTLEPLHALKQVGNLTVAYTSLVDLQGLASLDTLGNGDPSLGHLTIGHNLLLTSLRGLDALTEANYLYVSGNTQLFSLADLGLVAVGGLDIGHNGLTDLATFTSLDLVRGDVVIWHRGLASFNPPNLREIQGNLTTMQQPILDPDVGKPLVTVDLRSVRTIGGQVDLGGGFGPGDYVYHVDEVLLGPVDIVGHFIVGENSQIEIISLVGDSTVGGNLNVGSNDCQLSSIAGLAGITTVGGSISIVGNKGFSNEHAQGVAGTIQAGNVSISGNGVDTCLPVIGCIPACPDALGPGRHGGRLHGRRRRPDCTDRAEAG